MEGNASVALVLDQQEESPQNDQSLGDSTRDQNVDMAAFTQTSTPAPSNRAEMSKRPMKKARLPLDSVDIMVQKTNDDSVTSKRSAVTCGYFDDPFLRYFVRKPSRRSPLVNRGYYLRMIAISDIVTNCIDYFLKNGIATIDTPLYVISLGAGYDTLAMRILLAGYDIREGGGASRRKNPQSDALINRWKLLRKECVRFCDVDFPQVMRAKAALMQAAPSGSFPSDWVFQPSNDTCPVVSRQYCALGFDLRGSPQKLSQLLKEVIPEFSADAPIFLYAECMMQYMPAKDAAQLIRGIAAQFPNAILLSYDQICPEDSFGKLMARTLTQKASPLLGINTTPNGSALTSRLIAQGMAYAFFANFYDISRFYLSGTELERVDALESFDELEEWCEMCEHYGITLAGTAASSKSVAHPCPFFHPPAPLSQVGPAATDAKAGTTVSVRYVPWPTGRFCYEGWGNGDVFVECHPLTKEWVFIGFGGFLAGSTGGHRRNGAVFAHAFREGAMKVTLALSPTPLPELVFHSISRLSPYCYVVFGGRGNPAAPSPAAFLLRAQISPMGEVIVSWDPLRLEDEEEAAAVGKGKVPCARYRHTAVTLSGTEVFVFGGRNARGEVLGDAWMATIDGSARTIRWRPLSFPEEARAPPAMCSAAAIMGTKPGELLLSGGMLRDGQCNSTLWSVDTANGAWSALDIPIGSACARFSHTMTRVTVNDLELILILGGCGWEPRAKMPPALLLNIQTMTMTTLQLPVECPTWARHCCVSLGKGRLAIVGGGYTCFSFGTFTSKPTLLEIGDVVDPIPIQTPSLCTEPSQTSTTGHTAGSHDIAHKDAGLLVSLLSLPRPAVEEAKGPLALEKFMQAMRDCARPVVLRHATLGSCVEKWADPNYLKQATRDMVVSVHVAKGSYLLDFVRKNFAFRHVPFHELIQHMQDATSYYRAHGKVPDECWYFRSIATHMKSEKANLWKDFKVLGQDFSLPDGIREHVMPKMHQCCLRINAPPLQLWTHYDTMENVLAQIVGRKRVVLFPPGQYGNLYTTGSSSPVLNIDAPNLNQYPRFIDACKNALELILEPGDLLYFPSNWHHHITSLVEETEHAPPYSLSVNVFFRRFDSSHYDKKDLYGNKDLPAVVELRQKITTQVQELLDNQLLNTGGEPLRPEYKEFALRQALQYLEGVADSIAASAKR